MADNKMCARVTRAAKKRAAAASLADEQSANKKRVVLGELPNLSNVIVAVDSNSAVDTQNPRPITKTKQLKKAVTTKTPSVPNVKTGNAGNDAASSDDPQMCGPYASDIYAYLHKMEVMGISVIGLIR